MRQSFATAFWPCLVMMPSSSLARAASSASKVILVDMDGVLCDFEAHFLHKWREAHPDRQWIPTEQRQSHYVDMDPSGVYDTGRSHAIITSPGFYETMPPIAGAVEALLQMDAEPGLKVRICTAPFGTGDTAAR
eukprot:gnl/TRDRNA2_/TRDRNA2_68411_c0_seq1.p2 gnl/TRDRNA2_/TRDRNA2_68411_c0~~gnl/TRDRNA2_/TRDRNA2_68411_c0_seq1.p2  ORF type:complete len:134 (-),score=11.58 gnl/TRDRNA2_/TRDRNA2_68411_c0_seq1:445-846(-)